MSERQFPLVAGILLSEVPADLFPLFNVNRVPELGGDKRPTKKLEGYSYSVGASPMSSLFSKNSDGFRCLVEGDERIAVVEQILGNPEVLARLERIRPVYEARTGKAFPAFYEAPSDSDSDSGSPEPSPEPSEPSPEPSPTKPRRSRRKTA
jgi:hypothetical protein